MTGRADKVTLKLGVADISPPPSIGMSGASACCSSTLVASVS